MKNPLSRLASLLIGLLIVGVAILLMQILPSLGKPLESSRDASFRLVRPGEGRGVGGQRPDKFIRFDPAESAALHRRSWLNESKLGLSFRWNPGFRPADRFVATKWVDAAKRLGSGFLIFPVKSVDGPTLWRPVFEEFDEVVGPPRRDYARELSEVCERQGVRFCVSYSLTDKTSDLQERDFPAHVEKTLANLDELLTHYPTHGVWFDDEGTRSFEDWRGMDLLATVRRIRPLAFTNDRVGAGSRGALPGVDIYTAKTKPGGGGMFADSARGVHVESLELGDPPLESETIIKKLVESASKGVNLLLEVRPRSDGEIPESVLARLSEVGSWTKSRKDAVHGTFPSPFAPDAVDFPVLMNGKRLYLFLDRDTSKRKSILLPGLRNDVEDAWVLIGGTRFEVSLENDTLAFRPPEESFDGPYMTIVLQLDGAPTVR